MTKLPLLSRIQLKNCTQHPIVRLKGDKNPSPFYVPLMTEERHIRQVIKFPKNIHVEKFNYDGRSNIDFSWQINHTSFEFQPIQEHRSTAKITSILQTQEFVTNRVLDIECRTSKG